MHILPAVTEKVQDLVLSERIETVIPLTYILCFLSAYYGPNASVLCGIKLTIWHHQVPTRQRHTSNCLPITLAKNEKCRHLNFQF